MFNILQNPFLWNNDVTNILDLKLQEVICADYIMVIQQRRQLGKLKNVHVRSRCQGRLVKAQQAGKRA
jgi:hypothetical protein